MQLDLTVSLGNVLSLAGTVAAIFLAYGGIRERLVALEVKVNALWERRDTSRD